MLTIVETLAFWVTAPRFNFIVVSCGYFLYPEFVSIFRLRVSSVNKSRTQLLKKNLTCKSIIVILLQNKKISFHTKCCTIWCMNPLRAVQSFEVITLNNCAIRAVKSSCVESSCFYPTVATVVVTRIITIFIHSIFIIFLYFNLKTSQILSILSY